ncbi:MAG: flagellar basal-body MS-ring/collar protein FliF [Gallionella sp.]
MSEPANTTIPEHPPSALAQLSLQQKMGLGVGIAALIALIVGAWIWGQTPEYRVLYSHLSDRDGGDIIVSLQQLNIPYKFAEGGGALMIPADQVHEARLKLASQGLPKGGTVGFELMEKEKFGITQFAERVNYQRALEGELARSVQSIDSVLRARIHLAIPKPSVFIQEQQQPSASVVLTMRNGRQLDPAQVSAIVHLISSSVPNLSTKNVTVVNQKGTLLSAGHDENGLGLDAKQLKYVRSIEKNYIKRIEDILTPLYGKSNIRAQVTVNIDFSRTEQTAESYKPNKDPKQSSIRSQQELETKNSSGLGSGVPGALTNQPPAPATAPLIATNGANGTNSKNTRNLHKETTVNYELDRTIRHTILPVGMIQRLSVAVIVNNRKITDSKGKISYTPLSNAEKIQINNLVKNAVGFDPKRGDSLNVQNVAFKVEKEVPVKPVPLWKQPEMIELAKLLIKYLIIAVVMLIVVFKIIKPAFSPLLPKPDNSNEEEEEEEEEDAESADQHDAVNPDPVEGVDDGSGHYTPPIAPYEQNLNIAKQIAQQDPKIVAGVIKDWVNGNE